MPSPRFSFSASARASSAAMRWVLLSRWLTTSGGVVSATRERHDRPRRWRQIRSGPRYGNQTARILRLSFLKSECMAVPLQNELGGGAAPALADGDAEGRQADRAGERPGKGCAPGSRRRRDDQPDGGGGRLGEGRLAHQE